MPAIFYKGCRLFCGRCISSLCSGLSRLLLAYQTILSLRVLISVSCLTLKIFFLAHPSLLLLCLSIEATAKIMTADYAEAGCQKSEFAFMPSENEELSKNDTSDSSRASKASVIEESRVVPGVSVPLSDEEKKVVGEISSLLRHLDVSRQHYGLTFLGNDITKQQAIALGSTLIGVGAFFFNSALRNA